MKLVQLSRLFPSSRGRICLTQKGTMQLAQTILVTSGKGGVGKSTVSVLLGAALAHGGKRVLLLEMDSGLRGMDIMLGVQDETVFDLSDVLTRRCEPIKAMAVCPYQPGLYLLPAPYDHCFIPDQGDLIRLTRGLAHHFDYLLVDTPAGLGRNFQAAAAVADRALLVATPDPICVRDGRKVADTLEALGVGNIRLVINKVTPQLARMKMLPDLDAVIDGVGVQLIGVVPQENQVMEAAAKGRPLPNSAVCRRVFANLAGRIEGKYIPLAIG